MTTSTTPDTAPIATLEIAGHRISAHPDLLRAAGWNVQHRSAHDGDTAMRRLLRAVHECGASPDPAIEGSKAAMVLHRAIELGEVEAEHERRERARLEVARLERAAAADQLSATRLQARTAD